ncbi:LytR/AlgR family response regulator transcription factor [Flavobacterium urumqiense]|uniref:Two component transcriptional regulator, LytTR family n=1 Tax=Flavobacterium urumqiense TaxID=935224 RepID=A0A1H5TAM5_9FLAO|nr:LytTR family DNA-binding domain-containing protein [Flavobacterium urumqiense]SEF59839.1 two component transcriptional regulator, LytTR family [Flavobacterium urumqiense]
MNYSYIIIDDNQESFLNTKAVADGFSELVFVAEANNYSDGLNLILEFKPDLIFLEINPINKESNLSLALINELYRFLDVIPKIIITTTNKDLAFEAIQYEVADYLLKPLINIDLVKLILKLNKSCIPFQKSNETIILDEKPNAFVQHKPMNDEKPLMLCIKSYGDYRYIDAKDICYFQADNNSTDIHLNNGEMITAFKTLKHFEGILSFPFIRIHNSYIVNRNYISRIHTGNTVCYIKNTTVKLPFSKSYKANVDLIISDFSNGNYLEI